MRVTLHIWRQRNRESEGAFETHQMDEVSPDMSFLEMLDSLNEALVANGDEPIAFDSDCREGICGACSLVINGSPHGPEPATTTCQLYMRHFSDGAEITVEPFRAKAFPVVRDLVVDRRALDRIMQAGGYVSVNTGSAVEANAHAVAKEAAEMALDAAACLGCGACVAACPNASAMLFVAAKTTQYSLLPQGQPERIHRAISLVEAMDRAGFGACSNHYECAAACPEQIPVRFIARLNSEFLRAALTSREFAVPGDVHGHVE